MLDYGPSFEVKGQIKFYGSTSGYVLVKATAVAGAWTITLPTGVPAADGYVLSSTTAGVTSWVSVAGLSDSGVTAATYGSATAVGVFTVTAKGIITSATNTSITLAASAITSGKADLSAGTGLSGGAVNAVFTATSLSINQGFAPNWTGIHTFENQVNLSHALNVPYLYFNSTSGTRPVYQRFDIASAAKAYIGIAGATNDLVTGAVLGDLVIRDTANVLFSSDNGTSIHMKVANSGLVSVLAGTSTNRSALGGNLYVDSTTRNDNTGASTEVILSTYTVKGGALTAAGDTIECFFSGESFTIALTKTLKVYIDGTSFKTLGTGIFTGPWWAKLYITRVDATTVTVTLYGVNPENVLITKAASQTITLSGDFIIKVTNTTVSTGTTPYASEYSMICNYIRAGSN